MPSVSEKGKNLPSSPIRKLTEYANKAKERGVEVFHLNIGQPDIESPKVALEAVKNNSLSILSYGPSEGSEAFRTKMSAYYAGHQISVTSNQILVTTGASEALIFTLNVICDAGDEIIIPEPFYANYNGFASSASVNVVPVISEFTSQFELPSLENITDKITSKTKPSSATNIKVIRSIIENSENGYLQPQQVKELLIAAEIPIVQEIVCKTITECISAIKELQFPVVMKVVGPIHKSDVGGIILNISSEEKLTASFGDIMKIEGATSVLIQPMKKGIELFVGAKKEDAFGHLILCGLGGIYIEVLKDIQTCLSPVSKKEASKMIKQLRSYKVIQGIRNQEGINEVIFAEIVEKISCLLTIAPEIIELDLNPLLGNSKEIFAVDARIRIEKN